jgi:hypothetical protein
MGATLGAAVQGRLALEFAPDRSSFIVVEDRDGIDVYDLFRVV